MEDPVGHPEERGNPLEGAVQALVESLCRVVGLNDRSRDLPQHNQHVRAHLLPRIPWEIDGVQ